MTTSRMGSLALVLACSVMSQRQTSSDAQLQSLDKAGRIGPQLGNPDDILTLSSSDDDMLSSDAARNAAFLKKNSRLLNKIGIHIDSSVRSQLKNQTNAPDHKTNSPSEHPTEPPTSGTRQQKEDSEIVKAVIKKASTIAKKIKTAAPPGTKSKKTAKAKQTATAKKQVHRHKHLSPATKHAEAKITSSRGVKSLSKKLQSDPYVDDIYNVDNPEHVKTETDSFARNAMDGPLP